MRAFMLALAFVPTVHSLASAQDDELIRAGKRQFRACQACHGLDKGDNRNSGPTLYGLFGRKVASESGFGYSDAMKGANIVWTEEALDRFLTNPQTDIPGNKMALGAVKDPEQRTQLIAYLKTATKPE